MTRFCHAFCHVAKLHTPGCFCQSATPYGGGGTFGKDGSTTPNGGKIAGGVAKP